MLSAVMCRSFVGNWKGWGWLPGMLLPPTALVSDPMVPAPYVRGLQRDGSRSYQAEERQKGPSIPPTETLG